MLDMLVVAALDNHQFNQNIDNYQNNKVHVAESKVSINKNINQLENGNHPLIKKIDSKKVELSFDQKIDLAEQTKDVDILKSLAKDKEFSVRLSVAQNENSTIDVLKSLSKDNYENVRQSVLDNKNCTEELKKTMVDKNGFLNLSDEEYNSYQTKITYSDDVNFIKEQSNSKNPMFRMFVAQNENAPQDVLDSLANDKDFSVKSELINNPKISEKTLEKLAIDDDMDISTLAMEKIESKNIKVDSNEVHNSIVSMDYKGNQQSNSNSNSNSHKHR